MKNWRNSQMRCLLLVASLALVGSCGTVDTSHFPPSADLERTEEAQYDPNLIGSEAHLDSVQTRRETRGDRYDGQLERICLFFQKKGMQIDCTPKEDPLNP